MEKCSMFAPVKAQCPLEILKISQWLKVMFLESQRLPIVLMCQLQPTWLLLSLARKSVLMEVCSPPCAGTQGTPQTLVLTLRNMSYN